MKTRTSLLKRIMRMIGRVFPQCGTISQAIAFNLFLAFFPTLLIAVGFATSPIGGRTSLYDLIRDFTAFLPPGSAGIVSEFLVKRGPEAWKLALVGWGGTLLAGSQVMRLLMEGIQKIYSDQHKMGFWHRHLRGLALLVVTIAPLLIAALIGVLGRPIRRWVTVHFGPHHPMSGLWPIFFPAVAFVLALASLTVIYRVARPTEESLRNVLPGATVATTMWWLINVLFGFYVRRVPYSIVYGGLAAVIGLLVWMQISALIVFLGAAWNAELEENRKRAGAFV
jgi:membrane protein